jgi:hypothetical protein
VLAALSRGYADAALTLMLRGALLSRCSPATGTTPLMTAVRAGLLGVVKAMLARGVDVHAVRVDGETVRVRSRDGGAAG